MTCSARIPLTAFRQILLLPLTLTGAQQDVAAEVDAIAGEVQTSGRWEEVKDHLAHLGEVRDRFAYGEFVYFHAYIQDFLFDAKGEGSRPLRLFRRTGLGHLTVEIDMDQVFAAPDLSEIQGKDAPKQRRLRATLTVERMNLYLFELGVAILALEVSLPASPAIEIDAEQRPMTLAHALALQNALRRIYPPYFKEQPSDPGKPDPIPEYPALLDWDGAPDLVPRTRSEWLDHVATQRRNPIDRLWIAMMAPLVIEECASQRERRWRQIIDERMPAMVYVGVAEGTMIERSDFARLCFLDDPGHGYRYAESFLADFETEHCYDRFWYGAGGTRYLFSGFSMVVFGTGSPGDPEDFFHHTNVHHFRRHYFQIALLLQVQLAALLSLSHRVSDTVAAKATLSQDQFRARLLQIEQEMLAFEQRYWFSQVSNQDQPREMYRKWIDRTGIKPIYDEVGQQVRAANGYLDAREQEAQTRAASRLSVVATFGVIVGAALAFLGMNVVASPDFLAAFAVPKGLDDVAGKDHRLLLLPHLVTFFAVLGASSAAGLALLHRYGHPSAEPGRTRKNDTTLRLRHDLAWLTGVCGAAAIVLLIFRSVIAAGLPS